MAEPLRFSAEELLAYRELIVMPANSSTIRLGGEAMRFTVGALESLFRRPVHSRQAPASDGLATIKAMPYFRLRVEPTPASMPGQRIRAFVPGYNPEVEYSSKKHNYALGIARLYAGEHRHFLVEQHYPNLTPPLRIFYYIRTEDSEIDVREEIGPDTQAELWQEAYPGRAEDDLLFLSEAIDRMRKARRKYNAFKNGRAFCRLVHPLFADSLTAKNEIIDTISKEQHVRTI